MEKETILYNILYVDNRARNIIPEVIDGKTVTSVSKVCFNEFSGPADGFKNIESIFKVKEILKKDFNTNVEQINLPSIMSVENIEGISRYMFQKFHITLWKKDIFLTVDITHVVI